CMVNNGAGLYLEDSETTPASLKSLLKELIENPEKLHLIQESSTRLAKPDGVKKIVEQIKTAL
ncbi:MAG: hypothetical protein K2F57_02440, partial [Candidatus Gastranaerophilales bacterium]|nr:hypothetical protein [Candidatus Gastranaerophilales bacterium]